MKENKVKEKVLAALPFASIDIKAVVGIALISLVAAFFYTPSGETLDGAISTTGSSTSLSQAVGIFLLTFMLLFVSYSFVAINMKRAAFKTRDMLFLASLFAAAVVLLWFALFTSRAMAPAIGFLPEPLYIYLMPVAAGPMLVMLFLNASAAFIFAAVLSLFASFFLGAGFEAALYFFVGSVTGALGIRFSKQRSTVIKAGGVLGAVNAVTLLFFFLIKPGFALTGPLLLIFAGLVNGVVTAVITVGVAPLIEGVFRYKTSIKLLELSRMDHPLLKTLAMESPGTYHHSIVIGSLVEAAAESIGANALLARVAAYYHDIGKTKKPLYFIENMRGDNKHDKLAPSMSALIISNHVKEGVELAKSHRLGHEITDVIREHHGTTLMKFFYEKAKKESEDGEVDDREYRYPGPKPQTKESGLVMLADAVEAASKTLPDPSPDKIQGMTQKIINKYFTEGQLDECELTLKDLHLIGKSFNRVFTGIFHHRIEYPEPAYMTGREDGVKGINRGPDKKGSEGEDKEDSREGLKRLGL